MMIFIVALELSDYFAFIQKDKTFKSSRIRTINCRSHLANTFHVYKFNVGR